MQGKLRKKKNKNFSEKIFAVKKKLKAIMAGGQVAFLSGSGVDFETETGQKFTNQAEVKEYCQQICNKVEFTSNPRSANCGWIVHPDGKPPTGARVSESKATPKKFSDFEKMLHAHERCGCGNRRLGFTSQTEPEGNRDWTQWDALIAQKQAEIARARQNGSSKSYIEKLEQELVNLQRNRDEAWNRANANGGYRPPTGSGYNPSTGYNPNVGYNPNTGAYIRPPPSSYNPPSYTPGGGGMSTSYSMGGTGYGSQSQPELEADQSSQEPRRKSNRSRSKPKTYHPEGTQTRRKSKSRGRSSSKKRYNGNYSMEAEAEAEAEPRGRGRGRARSNGRGRKKGSKSKKGGSRSKSKSRSRSKSTGRFTRSR